MLRAGLTEVVVRDVIIAGDDEVEETETLYIDVYERQRSSSCRPSGTVVTVLTVTIEDDDSDTSGISPTEFTVTETDADASAALELTFAQACGCRLLLRVRAGLRAQHRRCIGCVGAFSAGSPAAVFVLRTGLTEVVVRDLIIAGDDEVEETETLYIDVYRPAACFDLFGQRFGSHGTDGHHRGRRFGHVGDLAHRVHRPVETDTDALGGAGA